MKFKRIAVLGVGLIGGSFAMAVKKHGLASHICGFGRRRENLEKARLRHIIDSFETDPSLAVKDADLIVLATPVGKFVELVSKISGSLKKGASVIDAGSIKGAMVSEIERLLPEGAGFVGCHPIAGSERSGIDQADSGLFDGALCIITKTENTDDALLARIKSLWEKLGSRVEVMDNTLHDRIYGAVSHMPHLVAYAIVNSVADIDPSYLRFSGKGLKDTTRIAGSSPEVWRDICMMNRENLLDFLGIVKKNIDLLAGCLESGDAAALEDLFKKARALREALG